MRALRPSAFVVPWLIGLAACVAPVAAGDGSISEPADQRLVAADRAALLTATQTSCRVAASRPDDVRALRKAAALSRSALASASEDERGRIAGWARPVLVHLDASAEPCATVPDAGETYVALGDDAAAAERYLRAAQQCHRASDAVAATHPLRRLHRCAEALALLRAAWPAATGDDRIPLLDAVTECSDAVSLRGNLAFVPASVRDDYFALLREREREAAEQQRRDEAYAAARQCEGHCSSLHSRCTLDCQSVTCSSRCSALAESCRAHCAAP